MLSPRFAIIACLVAVAACGSDDKPSPTAPQGVIFTFPLDAEKDVPVGSRVVVAFSDPVQASAIGTCTAQGGELCLVGPNGPVNATPEVAKDGKSVAFSDAQLDAGTQYQLYVGAGLAPFAKNLPASGPLVTFTTRTTRPNSAAPTLIAINGGDPANPESFRPMLDTSTIRLVFSEPLDPRSVVLGPGAIELLDARGQEVPATLLAGDVHASIDPTSDLAGGQAYTLKLGSQLVDLGGQAMAPTSITLTPHDTKGATGPIAQVLRTRVMGDPGSPSPRLGTTPNVIAMNKPLIGMETSNLQPSVLASELGDPQALNGPIAFRIPKGQRLTATGLDVQLGGVIPIGVQTGDIQIELLTDAGGLIYRNPHQAPDQTPENERAPLYVDLSMDVAVYAIDPTGNAVLAQTVLGVQGAGIVTATDGVLDIESVTSMELGLMGVTTAPSNMVLELITDLKATPATDTQAPSLVATYPDNGTALLPVDAGIELIFDEPIDIDRARAGGIQLEDGSGNAVASVLESHGSVVVVRPRAPLAYGTSYQVALSDVRDLAGNTLQAPSIPLPIKVATPTLVSTGVPATLVASHPGVACALTGGNATSPGRCSGGASGDDLYQPFTLAANEPVDVVFDQPIRNAVLGTSVKVEATDANGANATAVPGTLIKRDRELVFVPDQPWTAGNHYRLSLISGGSNTCSAGVLCGIQSAASFDPLAGTTSGNGGGPNAVFAFTGAAATGATYMVTATSPFSDINGTGFFETGEIARDDNRVELKITGTSGSVGSAHFNGNDCDTSTPEIEPCIYLSGALPVDMQDVQSNCTLPDGSTAASCMPVAMSAQAMYGTSVNMTASVVVSITSDTGTSVMRVREPKSGGPPMGYIVDMGGTPTLVAQLDLYMDAPDLSLPLGATHDLHSKPLSVALQGPMKVQPDGRIAISASNTADVKFAVNINAPIVGAGAIDMVIPKGQMHLQLLSPALRGAAP
ncbi:MAG: Ig-like domain-containing protein [Acidobacteriota bacterium]